tara:strand:+ start:1031 stop:2692 length:1662 start_codon:yes stop_codon:yes gene_type:complete
LKRAINTKTFYFLISLCIGLNIHSCAAIAPPSGGPDDEIPPKFTGSIPESGSTEFKGGKVVLQFSEFIDKRSIERAISVSPEPETPVDVIYDDDEIQLFFPEKLLSNQTYIISINRTLTDERNVALDKSIQIAFSTGSAIENGKIMGRVFGDDKYAVHLWKLNNDIMDTLYFSKPLYVSEADDKGFFEFNFLSTGKYGALAVDRSAAGLPLNTERIAYGLGPQLAYNLSSNEVIKDISFMVQRETPKIKLTHVDWKGPRWGWMHFNQPLNDISFEGVRIIDSDSSKLIPSYYQDSKDKSRFLLTLKDTLNEGRVNLNIEKIMPNNGQSISNSVINFRVSNEPDSSHLYLLEPPLTSIINKDNKGGPLLSVVFSKPIESFSDSAFQIISDSDTILASMIEVNPLEFTFLPIKGWKEKETYRLLLFSKYLLPIEGKSFPDPIKSIDVISKKKIGYGTIIGSLVGAQKPSIVRLKLISKVPEFFVSDVDSNDEFYANELPEGKYELMVINDSNKDKSFNYGTVMPLKKSEWFYVSPDTFEVRANWEIDIGKIDIEK